MKRIILILVLLLFYNTTLLAYAGIIGEKEMLKRSELIAIVTIQELTLIDSSRYNMELLATGYVTHVLKGKSIGVIKFRIPRYFPCAAFDVSTGAHIVFLERNDKDEYEGGNWSMSYIYLHGKTVSWFDDSGKVVEYDDPMKVINRIEAILKQGEEDTDKNE